METMKDIVVYKEVDDLANSQHSLIYRKLAILNRDSRTNLYNIDKVSSCHHSLLSTFKCFQVTLWKYYMRMGAMRVAI